VPAGRDQGAHGAPLAEQVDLDGVLELVRVDGGDRLLGRSAPGVGHRIVDHRQRILSW
jgi:hypothetical protein